MKKEDCFMGVLFSLSIIIRSFGRKYVFPVLLDVRWGSTPSKLRCKNGAMLPHEALVQAATAIVLMALASSKR